MRDAERGRDRRRAADPGRRRRGDPGHDPRTTHRRPAESAEGVESVRDVPPSASPAREERRQHGRTHEPAENEHRPERQRPHRRPDHDEHAEDERPRRPDRAEDAPGRPVAVAPPPEGAREERDPRRVADPGRHRRVHERADPVAGDSAGPVDPPAAEMDCGAPHPRVAEQRREEAHRGGPEPDRPSVLEAPEGAAHVRSEQLRRRHDRENGHQHDSAGDQHGTPRQRLELGSREPHRSH